MRPCNGGTTEEEDRMGFETSSAGSFALLAILLGLGSTVFWMVVGWRALQTFEKIGVAVQQMAAREARSRGKGGAGDRG